MTILNFWTKQIHLIMNVLIKSRKWDNNDYIVIVIRHKLKPLLRVIILLLSFINESNVVKTNNIIYNAKSFSKNC